MKINQEELDKIRLEKINKKLKKLNWKSDKKIIKFISATIITTTILTAVNFSGSIIRNKNDFKYNNELTSIYTENGITIDLYNTVITEELEKEFMHKITYTTPIIKTYKGYIRNTYEIFINPGELENFQNNFDFNINDLIIDNEINYKLITNLINQKENIKFVDDITITTDTYTKDDVNIYDKDGYLEVIIGNYEPLNLSINDIIKDTYNNYKINFNVLTTAVIALPIGIILVIMEFIIKTFAKNEIYDKLIEELEKEKKAVLKRVKKK